MDTKQEIQEFLTSRRARITPAQAGVRTFGSGPRRVPGLRREEVASLAGVSIAYYTKLERGDASGVSDTVLEALSRALQLDDAERSHLFDLVRAQQPVAANTPPPQRAADDPPERAAAARPHRRTRLHPQRPHGHRRDEQARRGALLRDPRQPAPPREHSAVLLPRPARDRRSTSTGTRARDASVAVLRAEAGRNPHDQELTNLIGELSTQSEDFRVRWARHDVGTHDAGLKRLHHPLVGRLELTYEGMTLAADPDLMLFAFTAEVGSKSEEALNLLASWATTENQRITGGHQRPPLRARVRAFPRRAGPETATPLLQGRGHRRSRRRDRIRGHLSDDEECGECEQHRCRHEENTESGIRCDRWPCFQRPGQPGARGRLREIR